VGISGLLEEVRELVDVGWRDRAGLDGCAIASDRIVREETAGVERRERSCAKNGGQQRNSRAGATPGSEGTHDRRAP
jgi:hypothetical protein